MKKITVLFTVLLMLAASSAFAAITVEYPAGLNATNKYVTGFAANATVGKIGVNNGTLYVFNSSKSGVYILNNGTIAISPSAISYHNSSASTAYSGFLNATKVDNMLSFNQAVGSVTGLTTLLGNNATNATTYMVNTGGYATLVGVNNSTILTSGGSRPQVTANGTTMVMMYSNGTFASDMFSSSNTWDYYAYGISNATLKPYVIVGQVKLNERTGADNAQAKYVIYQDGTKTDKTSTWLSYNATGATKNELVLTSTAGITLIQNGTVNADRTKITGVVYNSNSDRLFAVMVKSGSKLSTNDLSNRAFKLVYSGAFTASKLAGNATSAIAAFTFDSNLGMDGNMAQFTNGTLNGTFDNTSSLSGFRAALADTSFFGSLTQSNMTIYDTDGSTVIGSFYGKQAGEKDMIVGIYEPVSSGTTYGYALAFLIPNPAVTAKITTAGTAYQNNGTLTLHGLDLNSTAYSQTALRTQWSGIPSYFTPLTDVKGFNATYTESQKGSVYYTFQYKFTGIGDKIANLRLYKVFPTTDATVREYSYASSASPSSDGAWWISSATADGYLNKNSVLAPSVEYYVNYVVKDNGNYDYKTTAKQIGDPVVLGSVPTSADSSSSSGCVFNPAAGFGLEWLLLMLAPMVAIVRSRFKK